MSTNTVRSGAEERAGRSYLQLITSSADWNGPNFHKNVTFLVQAGTFLCCQARRSSAAHYSNGPISLYTS